MLSQPPLKLYASRGIQTDLTLAPQFACSCTARSNQLYSVPNGEPAAAGLDSPSEFFCGPLDPSTLACESAYTQYTCTPDIPELDPYRQKAKPSLIGYNRPIDHITHSNRVVSLPNNAPHDQTEVMMERQMRIVSMPEFTRDGHDSARNEEMDHIRRYPSDLPRTPSPPSSPESIMIVGNDSNQVSNSFLRRSSTDDDGWITWASSPPRPIPALHGPLSLPYARCPSGAEGTLVEGDDLPHKIWGLGIDSTHSRSSVTNRAVAPSNQSLQSSGPASNCTHSSATNTHLEHAQSAKATTIRGDAIIDLSKPSTFHACVDDSGYLASTYAGVYVSDTVCGNNLPSPPIAAVIDVDLPVVWQRDSSKTKSTFEHYVSQPSEKGLTNNLEVYGTSRHHQLNKSAPLFIPGSLPLDGHRKSAYTRSPEEHNQFDSRNTAFSQTICLQGDHSASPSTCSPAWSPVFPGNSVEVEILRHVHSKDDALTGPRSYGPKVFSPPLGHSSPLLAMIQQVGNQDPDGIPVNYPNDLVVPVDSYFSNSLNERCDKRSVDYRETYTFPRLSDQSYKFSYQPRSVPLARLIQRRLSVVTEDVGAGPASLLQRGGCYSKSKQSDYEVMVRTKEVVSTAKADLDTETAQNTISVEVIPDDRESNAVVKLPRRSVYSAAGLSNNQTHRDATSAATMGARSMKARNVSEVA